MKNLFGNKQSNEASPISPTHIESPALLLTARQVSWTVAGFFLLSFCIFMAGYFLGQRNAISDGTGKIEQESLGDFISASLYSLNNKDVDESADDDASSDNPPSVEEVLAELETQDARAGVWLEREGETAVHVSMESAQEVIDASGDDLIVQYYGEVAGFSTVKGAQLCVDRLLKVGIITEVKKRVSKTMVGKRVTWYQVVTPPFADQEQLIAVARVIEKKEHLKDKVHIRTC